MFNCQRAGKWPPIAGVLYEHPSSESAPPPLSGLVSPRDVDLLEEVANKSWRGECAVYAFNSGQATTLFRYISKLFATNSIFLIPYKHLAGSLSVMPKKDNFEVSLGVLECEVFTISPIRVSKLLTFILH